MLSFCEFQQTRQLAQPDDIAEVYGDDASGFSYCKDAIFIAACIEPGMPLRFHLVLCGGDKLYTSLDDAERDAYEFALREIF
jgi:hypothetical protein